MQPTPQIIVRNFEQCERILCTETGTLDNLNLSNIITRLIQDVGRFCERFASDFIISWDMVRKQLEPRPVTEPYYTVEIFKSLVIKLVVLFFLSHFINDSGGVYFWFDIVYLMVLALGIEILPAESPERCPRVTCTLKDLTDELWRVEPGGLEENAA